MDLMSMSTDAVPAGDRFDYWRDAVRSMIYKVDVECSADPFAAKITARNRANLGCASFHCSAHTVHSGRERFSEAGAGSYLLSCQVEGAALVEQGNIQATLVPGSIAIVDGRLPMRVVFPRDVRRFVARLPVRLVERRLPFLVRRHASAFNGNGPLASILFNYVRELSSERLSARDTELELIAENICNLLSIISTLDGSPMVSSNELLKESLTRMLRREACNPALSLESVASSLFVSKRQVQRALQEMETSFTELVVEERLQAADRNLRDMPKVSVSQVAYLSGFNDISHFNHQFKRRFGMTPSDRRILQLSSQTGNQEP